MALPAGVTTFTLEFGSWTDVVGASAATTATGAPITGKLFPVDPSTNKRIRLTHITTGSVIVPANVPVSVAADGTGSVGPVPHTGQTALSPNGYALRLEWDLPSNFQGRPQDLTFVVDSGATADFDLLVPAATVPAVAISQPTVASVNAKTGAVTLTASDVGAATPADLTAGLADKQNAADLPAAMDAVAADTSSAFSVRQRAAFAPVSLADRGPFSPAATYVRGDLVQYNGARYAAAQDGGSTSATTTRTNWVPNPRMQNSRAGWSAGTNTTATADAAKAQATVTTTAAIAIGNSVYQLSADIPTVAGEIWSGAMQVSVPASAPAVTVRATLAFFPATSNANGSMVTIQPGGSAVLSVTNATTPVGKNGVRLFLQAGTGGLPSGAVLIVEAPIVEKSATAGGYFSGATADTASTDYAWTGTADSSPSTAVTATVTNALGVPGSAGAGWQLIAAATKPTRTALSTAFTPTITDATHRITWLADDRITLLSSNAPAFTFSRDDGATWTTAHTFTDAVISARSLPGGEMLVATRAVVTAGTPFELWLSTGWQADPTTATWAKVLTATTPMASPASGWSWSIHGNLILVAEYGPKEGTIYSGQTVAPGGNARYVYRSLDGGRTWTTMFDLNAWLTATGNQSTTGCHLHGVHFDPYWDRIWITHGDNRNGILFSDDLGVTWQQAQSGEGTAGLYQSVGIISLPQCVLFASDGAPNGVARISRSQGKHAGAYILEDAYSINNQATLTHLCQAVFKSPRPGDDGPVIFGFAPDVVAGKSVIVTTVDGYTFNGAWTDSGADATAGLDGAFGPTVRGNLVAHNGTTSKNLVGPMPAY